MKIVVLFVLGVVALGFGGLFYLAQKSKSGAAPGLVNGALAPCPSSPNCVVSEPGAPDSHAVEPLPLAAWDDIPNAVKNAGGEIVFEDDGYLAATFSSSVFGFVDDVEFRKAEDAVHARSAARVGHSDMGVNRARIEAFRAALAP